MPAARTTARDSALIARLQKQASQNPGAYRLRLTALAIAGDVALTTVQIVPWCAPILLGMLFVNRSAFYLMGGAAIVFLAWVVRPRFRMSGRELSLEEAPE